MVVLLVYVLCCIYICVCVAYISCACCVSTDSHTVSTDEVDTFDYKIKDEVKTVMTMAGMDWWPEPGAMMESVCRLYIYFRGPQLWLRK